MISDLRPESSAPMVAREESLVGPKVLIAHPWMGFGGSEATAAWTVHALQDRCQVSFASASGVDWDQVNDVYGTSIDSARIENIRTRRLPGCQSGSRLAHLQQAFFERECARIASKFDVCISTYNFINFRRKAIQLVADYSFSEYLRKHLSCSEQENALHRDSLFRRAYLFAGELIRCSENVGGAHFSKGDLILANSKWMAGRLDEMLSIKVNGVIFPPVYLPKIFGVDANPRQPFTFIILGRIDPEKRVEEAIEILRRVREQFPRVRLGLAGAMSGDPEYNEMIIRLVAENQDWVSYLGFLNAAERDLLLRETSFGIHTRINEAFGIAVAEMAGFGCIPFIPDDSGPAEIVERENLQYSTTDEAVEKIAAVLTCTPALIEKLRGEVKGNIARFEADEYVKQIRSHVSEFLGLEVDRPLSLLAELPVT